MLRLKGAGTAGDHSTLRTRAPSEGNRGCWGPQHPENMHSGQREQGLLGTAAPREHVLRPKGAGTAGDRSTPRTRAPSKGSRDCWGPQHTENTCSVRREQGLLGTAAPREHVLRPKGAGAAGDRSTQRTRALAKGSRDCWGPQHPENRCSIQREQGLLGTAAPREHVLHPKGAGAAGDRSTQRTRAPSEGSRDCWGPQHPENTCSVRREQGLLGTAAPREHLLRPKGAGTAGDRSTPRTRAPSEGSRGCWGPQHPENTCSIQREQGLLGTAAPREHVLHPKGAGTAGDRSTPRTRAPSEGSRGCWGPQHPENTCSVRREQGLLGTAAPREHVLRPKGAGTAGDRSTPRTRAPSEGSRGCWGPQHPENTCSIRREQGLLGTAAPREHVLHPKGAGTAGDRSTPRTRAPSEGSRGCWGPQHPENTRSVRREQGLLGTAAPREHVLRPKGAGAAGDRSTPRTRAPESRDSGQGSHEARKGWPQL
ncbi:hypothetical protein P7K49_020312 [Saguinus oedipus]|uniref:Collagen alpha-1(I) chain-like n=1 Tax=Saguinus oedipus TaxID=9490 RepID=A0ABQ9V0T7_SAGOE|nr:hypothetical protein P7K49_020312 [Saguinus oedipus]